jgi:hypothetical protein
MLVIGEIINAVIFRLGQAVVPHNAEAEFSMGRGQVESRSQILCVNTGRAAGGDMWCSDCPQASCVGKMGAQ